MLKNIDPLLSPELLSTLRAMGHGDEIAIVDANYPAVSSGVPLVRLDAASTTQVLEAVLSVLPLDEFESCAAFHMQVVGDPIRRAADLPGVPRSAAQHEPQVASLGSIERFAFYERVKRLLCGRRDRRTPALRQYHPEEGDHPARLAVPSLRSGTARPDRERHLDRQATRPGCQDRSPARANGAGRLNAFVGWVIGSKQNHSTPTGVYR